MKKTCKFVSRLQIIREKSVYNTWFRKSFDKTTLFFVKIFLMNFLKNLCLILTFLQIVITSLSKKGFKLIPSKLHEKRSGKYVVVRISVANDGMFWALKMELGHLLRVISFETNLFGI